MSKINQSPGSSTAILDNLPIRSLTISQPKTKDEVSTDLKCNVILVTKYPFTAESENELSVKKAIF